MYCDRGKTRKLGDGLELKEVWESQGVEEHGVTQKETNNCFLSLLKKC